MRPLLLGLAVLLAVLGESQASAGERVRERIEKVVDKERQRAIQEALDAEFEVADQDEDGKLSRKEFGEYLIKEDHFEPAEKGEGTWLGKRRQNQPGIRGGETTTTEPTEDGPDAEVEENEAPTDGQGSQEEEEKFGTFFEGTARSFAMIIVSELGDETFIIAALMAMRHPRRVVLAGALAALYFMTIISAAMGAVMPKLISPEVTHRVATFMYFFFGCRLAWIGYHSEASEMDEEMEEVEKSLNSEKKSQQGPLAFLSKYITPIFLESLVLTFLAEWGDRSQIATITLAAHNNIWGVILGGCIGHTVCTTIAVYGGRLIATQISQRTVAFAGSATFFVFAVLNLVR